MNTILTLVAMVAIMVAPFVIAAILSAITRNPGARNGFGNFDWTDVGDSRDLDRAAHDLAAIRSRYE
ncbi:hypothetical protein BOO86_10345 [Mycobacterium sp. CBMA 234]|uniref:hypothetical protein n=1 Tax=Mycolicibacterium sp. CBMA 234 TaxID=1918495 RepID=UPI0012DFB17E|nr:hypothetical protein [Mycolicibacterium sp. CBMA 234]MUL64861.1 hypothetical protein [Mycolicibacterium sp. CBMA 234]